MTLEAVAIAYLLGSLPSSYLIVRWREGVDVRGLGSGNAGATNVLRLIGPKPASMTLLLDLAKGSLAMLVGRSFAVPLDLLGAVALAAVIGHVFPVWLRFRGGKGVATAAGAFLVWTPYALAAALLVFVVSLALGRWVSLASILATATVPLALLGQRLIGDSGPSIGLIGWALAIAVLILSKHRTNLSRLLRGEEARLGHRLEGTCDK